jgi:hypothetical protein
LSILLAGWAEERFPLYAYHLSRHMPPAKVRSTPDQHDDDARLARHPFGAREASFHVAAFIL